MARVEIVYLPGASLPDGKLNSPRSFVTTVVVTVVPSFLALTSTPSIRPSSVEETLPLNVCACAPAMPATVNIVVASRNILNLMISSPCESNRGDDFPQALASHFSAHSHRGRPAETREAIRRPLSCDPFANAGWP